MNINVKLDPNGRMGDRYRPVEIGHTLVSRYPTGVDGWRYVVEQYMMCNCRYCTYCKHGERRPHWNPVSWDRDHDTLEEAEQAAAALGFYRGFSKNPTF